MTPIISLVGLDWASRQAVGPNEHERLREISPIDRRQKAAEMCLRPIGGQAKWYIYDQQCTKYLQYKLDSSLCLLLTRPPPRHLRMLHDSSAITPLYRSFRRQIRLLPTVYLRYVALHIRKSPIMRIFSTVSTLNSKPATMCALYSTRRRPTCVPGRSSDSRK